MEADRDPWREAMRIGRALTPLPHSSADFWLYRAYLFRLASS
jgi:hypothetical protein